MSQTRQFQLLLVCNWLLQMLLLLLPISYWYAADPMVDKMMKIDGYRAILNWGNPIIYEIPLWGFLIASVGMFFFRNWARYLYLTLWLYVWVVTLFLGFRVSIPAQGFIGMTISTIDGMILYLAFFSALRFEFTKSNVKSMGS